jgi:hypothetical protein
MCRSIVSADTLPTLAMKSEGAHSPFSLSDRLLDSLLQSLSYLLDENAPSTPRDPDDAVHEQIFGMSAKYNFPHILILPCAPSEGNKQARRRRLGRRLERFIPGMNPGAYAHKSL